METLKIDKFDEWGYSVKELVEKYGFSLSENGSFSILQGNILFKDIHFYARLICKGKPYSLELFPIIDGLHIPDYPSKKIEREYRNVTKGYARDRQFPFYDNGNTG